MEQGWATTDDGVRLWCETTGVGPHLVLTHGGPGLADDLTPLATLVEDRATVVRWDQRGVGRSDPVDPGTHALDRYVADLDTVRRHVGAERWVVGGHSFGATIALRYALHHPERTAGYVSIAGVGTGGSWRAAHREASARRLTEAQRERRDDLGGRPRTPAEEVEWRTLQWLPDFTGPDAQAHAAALAAAPDPICWEANRALNAEVRTLDEEVILGRCRELDVPALLLHGEGDTRPVEALASLVDALPQAELVVVPGAGHRPWVEAPDAVRTALRRWWGSTT